MYSDEKEEEQLIEDLHSIFTSKYIRPTEKGVEGEVLLIKEIRNAITEIKLTEPWKIEEIQRSMNQLQRKLTEYSIKADFLDRRFRIRMFMRQLIVSASVLLIGLPIFVYGLIHNLFQYKITDVIIPRISRDVEYYAALSLLIGLFLYPFTYGVFTWLVHSVFGLNTLETILYFVSLPVSGLLAYSFSRYLRHISFKSTFLFRIMKDKERVIELQNEKNKLRKLVFKD